MPGDQGGRRDRPRVYEETLQVRVRKKNPPIERPAPAKRMDSATVLEDSPLDPQTPLLEPLARANAETRLMTQDPAVQASVSPLRDLYQAPEPSEAGGSIYELIEETDRSELAAAEQTLREVLGATEEEAPARVALYLDEEETVLAAPKPPPRWEQKADQIRVKRARPRTEVITEESRQQGALPRQRMVGSGTDAASAEVYRQMIQQRAADLPSIHHPALKIMKGELSAADLAVLDRTLTGEFENRTSDPTLSPKRCLEHLINERGFNDLTPKDRAPFLSAIASEPTDVTTLKASLALAKTGVLKRLRNSERERLGRLFATVGPETRARLARLAARKLRGRSALEDRDLGDTGLVEHLSAMQSERGFATILEAAGLKQRRLAGLVIGAIAHPERLSFSEGTGGVIGMLEFGLADVSPAELARLWRGLLFGDTQVELAGKILVGLDGRADALAAKETPLRLVLEDLAEKVRPGRVRRPTFTMPGGHGVDADVVSRALEALYGVGFTVVAGAVGALRHLERASKEPDRVPPIYVSVLSERGERLFLFDHLENDWVYLRAPHGKSSKRPGTVRLEPTREVVDPDRSLDRIPLADFKANAGVALIPRT